MSEPHPVYKGTPAEELPNHDPSTTLQPQQAMATAPDQYMSRYNTGIMAHYPEGTSPSNYNQGLLHHPPAQWDPQTQGYRPMQPHMYYHSGNTIMPQQDVSHTQYTQQYSRWPTQPSVPVNAETRPVGDEYYPPGTTHTAYRAGELHQHQQPGPSRTARTTGAARRRSTQDVSLNIPQTDGSAGDMSEYSPTVPSPALPPSKRSQGPAAKSSSTAASAGEKSFSCTLCSATFTRKGDCLRHRRSVHTRETPYDCQGCGERFSRSDMRGKHWKADPGCEGTHWREVCRAMGKESLVDDI